MLPAKLAGERSRRGRSCARRVAGGAAGDVRLGRDRAGAARSSPSACARRRRGRRCSRRSPASRSGSSRSASSSARSRIRSSGSTTLAIVMLTYFGRVRFKGRIPGGLVAVALGHAALLDDRHRAGRRTRRPLPPFTCRSPSSAICSPRSAAATCCRTCRSSSRWACSTCSARSRTSSRRKRPATRTTRGPSLTVNGIGSVAAALFGSAFPTTIYIGHPGWKAMGARAGYSMLNGAFVTIDLRHRARWRGSRGPFPIDAGHGDRPVDRHRDQRAGVPGHAARARARRRHRPAAGDRRVGRADGQERAARRRARRRRRGRSAKRSSASSRRATRGFAARSRSSRDSSSPR